MSGQGFHRKEIIAVAADHGVAAGGIGENPGPQQWWRSLSVLRATGVVPPGEWSPAVTDSWSLLAVARGVPPEEGKCSHHPAAELSFCPPELEYYAAVAGQDARGTASPDPGLSSAQRSIELAADAGYGWPLPPWPSGRSMEGDLSASTPAGHRAGSRHSDAAASRRLQLLFSEVMEESTSCVCRAGCASRPDFRSTSEILGCSHQLGGNGHPILERRVHGHWGVQLGQETPASWATATGVQTPGSDCQTHRKALSATPARGYTTASWQGLHGGIGYSHKRVSSQAASRVPAPFRG